MLREGDLVPAAALEELAAFVKRRLDGEPVARILGRWEFYGIDFVLGPDTLVPRPETELLVDLALSAIKELAAPRLLDLGTGTGCIPVAILCNNAAASALATDLSSEALAVARQNAERHGVAGRLTFASGGWFDAVPDQERFDIIVSNPPYIERAIIPALMTEVREHDPVLALDGGEDGLDAYRAIAASALRHLMPRGRLLLEIGNDQAEAVTGILEDAGLGDIAVEKDLAGLDRVVVAHHLPLTDHITVLP